MIRMPKAFPMEFRREYVCLYVPFESMTRAVPDRASPGRASVADAGLAKREE
jgi:hypothetical protein